MNKYIKYAFALALPPVGCLLYTSDAADDLIGVDLGGRRIIKKKKNRQESEVGVVYKSRIRHSRRK